MTKSGLHLISNTALLQTWLVITIVLRNEQEVPMYHRKLSQPNQIIFILLLTSELEVQKMSWEARAPTRTYVIKQILSNDNMEDVCVRKTHIVVAIRLIAHLVKYCAPYAAWARVFQCACEIFLVYISMYHFVFVFYWMKYVVSNHR